MHSHKILSALVTVAMSLISSSVFAGNGKGSGGVVRACFQTQRIKEQVEKILIDNYGKPKSLQKDPLTAAALKDICEIDLFDFISPKPMEAQLVTSRSQDYREVVQERLENLKNTHFLLSGYFFGKNFHRPEFASATRHLPFDDTHFVFVNAGVIELGDPGMGVTLENNCLLLQIANQQIISDQESVVNIDGRLFELLNKKSPVHAAGLIVHEWSINITERLKDTEPFRNVAIPALPAQRLTRLLFDRNFVPENEHTKTLDYAAKIGFDFLKNQSDALLYRQVGNDLLALDDTGLHQKQFDAIEKRLGRSLFGFYLKNSSQSGGSFGDKPSGKWF